MINTVQKLTLACVKDDGCIKIYVLETERHAYGFWFGLVSQT
jgi:hypothetical protein